MMKADNYTNDENYEFMTADREREIKSCIANKKSLWGIVGSRATYSNKRIPKKASNKNWNKTHNRRWDLEFDWAI